MQSFGVQVSIFSASSTHVSASCGGVRDVLRGYRGYPLRPGTGFRFRVSCLVSRISGLGSGVSGFGSRVSGHGFQVSSFESQVGIQIICTGLYRFRNHRSLVYGSNLRLQRRLFTLQGSGSEKNPKASATLTSALHSGLGCRISGCNTNHLSRIPGCKTNGVPEALSDALEPVAFLQPCQAPNLPSPRSLSLQIKIKILIYICIYTYV